MKLIDDQDYISRYEQNYTTCEQLCMQTCEDPQFSPHFSLFMPILKENLVTQLLAYVFHKTLLYYMSLLDNFLACRILRYRSLFC